jgi:transcriptional regulator with XRE-family HTH domain
MSYLGIKLQQVAQENSRSQREIADAAGLTKSHIHRIFSGAQKFVTDEDFAAITSATATSQRERAEIVAARARDVINGPGADLVEVTVKGKPPNEKKDALAEAAAVKLPHDLERAIAFIRSQVPLNPALQETLLGMARAFGMK